MDIAVEQAPGRAPWKPIQRVGSRNTTWAAARPQSPDGGDLVIDAAVNGLADAIATFNLRDLRAPAARFGIAAEPPADILRRIR